MNHDCAPTNTVTLTWLAPAGVNVVEYIIEAKAVLPDVGWDRLPVDGDTISENETGLLSVTFPAQHMNEAGEVYHFYRVRVITETEQVYE
jgi:hypothetical protein